MIPKTPVRIMESVIKGKGYYGMLSAEIVRGDFDHESQQLIEEILAEDREHVYYLQRYFTR